MGITGARDEQKKAALTLKWINGQGLDHADLMKAEFIIQKIDEHISTSRERQIPMCRSST
jgi:hypothetical protein